MNENLLDLLVAEQTTPKIRYNVEQTNDDFAILAELVNGLHDDYIRFFCYNNKTAGFRARRQLRVISEKIKEMQNKMLYVKKRREEEGWIDV